MLLLVLLVLTQTSLAGAQENGSLPQWVDRGSYVEGDTKFELLRTEDFFLQSDASLVLRDQIKKAIENFIDETSGAGASRLVSFDDSHIQHHLVEQEIVFSKDIVDPTTQKTSRRHFGCALLRFDNEFANLINEQYHLKFKTCRLQWTGLTGVLILSWLGAAYGYLKLDHATRHFYSRRLQTLAIILCLIPLIVAAILAVALEIF